MIVILIDAFSLSGYYGYSIYYTQTPATGWNETKGVIRFTPMVEDRGKRLSCRAKNVNISRVTETGVVVLEPPAGQHHSAGYFPEHYKEDAKHLVVYGTSVQTSFCFSPSGLYISILYFLLLSIHRLINVGLATALLLERAYIMQWSLHGRMTCLLIIVISKVSISK